MAIIESIECRQGEFCSILPETIPSSHVHQRVTSNIGVRHRALRNEPEIREVGKRRSDGINTVSHVMDRDLSIDAIVPFCPDASVRSGRGSSSPLKVGDGLVRMLI